MRLILVRHGQAEHRGDEEDNLYLTDLGKRQVELLGQWLAENEPDITAIVCACGPPEAPRARRAPALGAATPRRAAVRP